MSTRSKSNEYSSLLENEENEAIFANLGRGCVSLSTGVVQLYLGEASNRQRWIQRCSGVVCFVKDYPHRSYFIRVYDGKSHMVVWEQEIYNQFQYNTPSEYFQTFEAHDCQAGLNFASEQEAAHFKKVVEGKLLERIRKRQERKNQQTGGSAKGIHAGGSTGTISVGSGPPPVQANVSLNRPATYFSNVQVPVKNGKNDKGMKKLSKEDISTPTDFRHVSHVGWDPNTGLDMQKLEPEMKQLMEQIGIEKSKVDVETIDFIYNFVDKHGGLDAMKKDLARKKPPSPPPAGAPPPPPIGRSPPQPHVVGKCPPSPPAREIHCPTSVHPHRGGGPSPLPPAQTCPMGVRPSTPTTAWTPAMPAPAPPSMATCNATPSRPHMGVPAPPPPPPPPIGHVAPPPPPMVQPPPPAEPPASALGRSGLLGEVKEEDNRRAPPGKSTNIVDSLLAALRNRQIAMQFSDDDGSSDENDDINW